MEAFLSVDIIVAFLTLTFLEIVLGIDNIIFISIVTGKLPQEKRKKATKIGLFLAMFLRIALLFGVTWIIAMEKTLFSINWSWFSANFNGQALILLAGGIFLIYKSTKEIHEKISHVQHHQPIDEPVQTKKIVYKSFTNTLFQILMIDLIFSVDSILTAVGMTNGLPGALYIMIAAVVVSVGVMMLFAVPIGKFVNNNPTIQILALSFLILIGFMLTTESMHLSNAVLGGQEIGAVPKGYLYFAIAFSLVVEFINMRIRKSSKA